MCFFFLQATHQDFANKLYATSEVTKSSRFSKPKLDRSGFTIEHYAGAVTYKTESFLVKNKDFVVAEHQQLMQNSTVQFIRALFPPEPEEAQSDKVRIVMLKSRLLLPFMSTGCMYTRGSSLHKNVQHLLRMLNFQHPELAMIEFT